MTDPLLRVSRLNVAYGRGRRRKLAVDGVSLSLDRGSTLGLVGESGCGKTSLASAILGLVSPSDGEVEFDGETITHVSAVRRRALTRQIQVVFQDPYSSLNPDRRIGKSVAEPLLAHHHLPRSALRDRVAAALERVGLEAGTADRYPFSLSGGQRQRVAIARALIVEPALVICDEPVSALDLSVQAQIVNLLLELQRNSGLTYLFISHDLDVVRHMADHIAVMKSGKIVEFGIAEEVYSHPQESYTQTLLDAALPPDPAARMLY